MDSIIYRTPTRHFVGERPSARERLSLHGPDHLGDAELLAVVLGTGTKGKGVLALAEELLSLVEPGSAPPDPARL
ncbi:MAG TPA: UPF0758 domain-containing protein [Rectinemataceae bacterium]|nr:UPF0758 domain-containing protein [Rectinemataceae bacterium]